MAETVTIVGGLGAPTTLPVKVQLDANEVGAAQNALNSLTSLLGDTRGAVEISTTQAADTTAHTLNIYNFSQPPVGAYTLAAGGQGVALYGTWAGKLVGHGGEEVLIGNSGNDTINAMSGSGSVIAGDGANTINLNSAGNPTGDMVVVLGRGNDSVLSWGGNQTISATIGGGSVHLAGMVVNANEVDLGNRTTLVVGDSNTGNVNITSGTNDTINVTDGTNTITSAVMGAKWSVSSGHNTISLGGNDSVTLASGYNTVTGSNEQITVKAGTDSITLGGSDKLSLAGGQSTVTLTGPTVAITQTGGTAVINSATGSGSMSLSGNDTVTLGSGTDTVTEKGAATISSMGSLSLRGGAGQLNVTLGSGSSTVVGGTLGSDTFTGGSGAATITGGKVDNYYNLGTGNESIKAEGTANNFIFDMSKVGPHSSDTISGFKAGGADKLELVGYDSTQATIAQSGSNTVITLQDGTTITLVGFNHANLNGSDISWT